MKVLIDTADVAIIKKLYQIYPFDGVTTNPKLLSQIDGNPVDILKNIRREIPENSELHVQVVSYKATDMIKEAKFILKEIGKETHIKVPVSLEGYKVINELAKQGIKVTATAIYNQAQAIMAAHAGAAAVAPYIHRINNKCYGGVAVATEIQKLLSVHQFKTELLAAAFENTDQVTRVLADGAESVTVAPDLLMEIMRNSLTEEAVLNFNDDFSRHFNRKNMLGE